MIRLQELVFGQTHTWTEGRTDVKVEIVIEIVWANLFHISQLRQVQKQFLNCGQRFLTYKILD